jgi:hypothetical protein
MQLKDKLHDVIFEENKLQEALYAKGFRRSAARAAGRDY